MTIEKKYMNVKDVSVYLTVPIKTIYEWADRGVIPSIKIGGRVLFVREEIDTCLQACQRPAYGKVHLTSN